MNKLTTPNRSIISRKTTAGIIVGLAIGIALLVVHARTLRIAVALTLVATVAAIWNRRG